MANHERNLGGGESKDINPMARLIGPCYSEDGVKKALAISSNKLESMIEDHEIIALKTSDNISVYPTFQFTKIENGTLDTLPGLPTILKAFKANEYGKSEEPVMSPWSLSVFLLTKNDILNGKSVIDHLKDRDKTKRAIEFSKSYAEGFKYDLPYEVIVDKFVNSIRSQN